MDKDHKIRSGHKEQSGRKRVKETQIVGMSTSRPWEVDWKEDVSAGRRAAGKLRPPDLKKNIDKEGKKKSESRNCERHKKMRRNARLPGGSSRGLQRPRRRWRWRLLPSSRGITLFIFRQLRCQRTSLSRARSVPGHGDGVVLQEVRN